MPLRPVTATGFLLHGLLPPQVSGPVLLPLPSSPELFRPQSMRVPFERSATLWLSTRPAEIATTPETPLTGIGFVLHLSGPHVSGPVLVAFRALRWSCYPTPRRCRS